MRVKPTIRILPDADQLARFVARLFLSRLTLTMPIQAQFTVALSGGSTPKKMFEILGNDERLKKQVKAGLWDYVHFFWSDERHVPPDHAESNYKLAFDSMLSPLGIRAANIHRIKGELEDAGEAASQYEAEILLSRSGLTQMKSNRRLSVFASPMFGSHLRRKDLTL